MAFEDLGGLYELIVHAGHVDFQPIDGLGGADAGNDVFTLGVDEVFAEQPLFACGGVAREGDAGAAVVAHVTENHGLHVDGGAPVSGDVVQAAVHDGARVVPGTEHGRNRFQKLRFRILREFLAFFLFVDSLECSNQRFQVVRIEFGIQMHAFGFLGGFQRMLEQVLFDPHHDVREHLDEAAVAVVCKPEISGFLRDAFHGDVIESQI
ncbi:hypothetical protein SDC9_155423 [bioreactor metagenome]|uniref:NAD-specific glutamate dehydrogenase n=1 Tax=bioreactor metagenome TaxID=1076179 RepID=A0A645F1G5_9ZZZZ